MTEKEYKKLQSVLKGPKGKQGKELKKDANIREKISYELDKVAGERPQSEKVAKSVKTTEAKLDNEGIDTDTRNPLEKFLNLKEDQNFLFDVFELLGRPQKAVFGAIDAAQTGEDALKSALEGITGNKETSGGQLLRNAGIGDDNNGVASVANPSTWGIDDIGGLALDIFADPMDLALFGSKSAVKGLDAASDVVKAGRKSGTDLVFQGIGNLAKGGAKLADTGIEKGLKYLDETKGVANSVGEIAKLAYKNPNAKLASNLGKEVVESTMKYIPTGRLESYKSAKNWFDKSFKNLASIPKETMDAIRKSNADEARAVIDLNNIRDNMFKNIDDTARVIAQKTGDTSEDAVKNIAKQLNEEMLKVKEFTNPINSAMDITEVLKETKAGQLKYTDELAGVLNEIAEDVNLADKGLRLSVDNVDGMLKLNDDWNVVLESMNIKKNTKKAKQYKEMYGDLSLDLNKFGDRTFSRPTNQSLEELNELKNIADKWSTDVDLQNLYGSIDNAFNEANNIIDSHFGTEMANLFKAEENAGYVRHTLNPDLDLAGFVKKGFLTQSEVDNLKLVGNTSALSKRKLNMSVAEANSWFKERLMKNYDSLDDASKKFVDSNTKLFQDLYTESFDSYIRDIPRLAKNMNDIDNVLVKQTFGNWKETDKINKAIKKAEKAGNIDEVAKLTSAYQTSLDGLNMKVLSAKDSVVPSGFQVLSKDSSEELLRKLNSMKAQLGTTGLDEFINVVKRSGDKIAINPEILRLVEVNQNLKTEASGLLRMLDSATNMFKRNKTLSPTFQMNNLIGNSSNMMLGGIGISKQAELFPEAFDIMSQSGELMRKRAAGLQLSPDELSKLNIWDNFLNAGFGDASKALDLQDMPDSLRRYFTGEKKFNGIKDYVVDGLPYLNNKMNNYMDTTARLVTFMEGSRNPQFLKNLGVQDAGDAIRKILFDPSDLSNFEKNVMKRVVPFYTFTKKNLAYHMGNLGQNGSRYHRMMKGYEALADNITDGGYDNMADYIKENMYIPIPGLGENGEYKVLRANLPFGQLLDTASNPIGSLVGSASPLLRMPFELANNTNTFTGREIEKFPGQKSTSLPFMTKQQEYLLGNLTGLDVPLKQGSRLLGDLTGQTQFGTLTMDQNINDDKLYADYDRLDKLQNIVKQYKQQGVEFSTANELKKANRNTTIENLNARLAKLRSLGK